MKNITNLLSSPIFYLGLVIAALITLQVMSPTPKPLSAKEEAEYRDMMMTSWAI